MKPLLACLILALLPASALAAGKKTSFGDWRAQCQPPGSGKNDCRLVQTVTRKKTNSLVVQFIVLPKPDGSAILVAQVPTGTYLGIKPGLRIIKPAAKPEQVLNWQRCGKRICEAAILLKPKEVRALDGATRVVFGYKADPNGKPILAPLSAAHLEEGLAALSPSR